MRAALGKADWVSLKVDAADEATWQKMNRPQASLALATVLDGMLQFAAEFKGELVTETMLVRSVNDSDAAIEAAAAFVERLHPRIAYVAAPTRPPSEPWVLPELVGMYAESVMANDTAAGVGYAPMTEAEQLVLETERYANSADFKALFPETGEDVKVTGVRSGRALELTVAMPQPDRYLAGERGYFERKEKRYRARRTSDRRRRIGGPAGVLSSAHER